MIFVYSYQSKKKLSLSIVAIDSKTRNKVAQIDFTAPARELALNSISSTCQSKWLLGR